MALSPRGVSALTAITLVSVGGFVGHETGVLEFRDYRDEETNELQLPVELNSESTDDTTQEIDTTTLPYASDEQIEKLATQIVQSQVEIFCPRPDDTDAQYWMSRKSNTGMTSEARALCVSPASVKSSGPVGGPTWLTFNAQYPVEQSENELPVSLGETFRNISDEQCLSYVDTMSNLVEDFLVSYDPRHNIDYIYRTEVLPEPNIVLPCSDFGKLIHQNDKDTI